MEATAASLGEQTLTQISPSVYRLEQRRMLPTLVSMRHCTLYFPDVGRTTPMDSYDLKA